MKINKEKLYQKTGVEVKNEKEFIELLRMTRENNEEFNIVVNCLESEE